MLVAEPEAAVVQAMVEMAPPVAVEVEEIIRESRVQMVTELAAAVVLGTPVHLSLVDQVDLVRL